MKQILVFLIIAAFCASLTTTVAAQDSPNGKPVQGKPVVKKGEREVMVQGHRFRFVIPKKWEMKEAEGIYMINSDNQKMLMVMVLLDKPEEVPEAVKELDKMVVVTGAKLSDPWNAIQGAIPMQYRAGSGTLQPSGRPVELLSVVMNIINRPVVTMFYVHKESSDLMLPQVKEVLKSFALLLTAKEVEELKKMKEEYDKTHPKKK